MRIAFALLPTLALAACGAPPPAAVANNSVAAPPLETNLNAVPDPDRPPLPADGNASAPGNDNSTAPAPPPGTNGAMPPFAEVPGAHPNPPVQSPVPAAFRGIWAESRARCADLGHPYRLVVSGSTLRFHESVMTVARVEGLGARSVNLVGTSTGEGETQPAEYHFSVNAAGDRLTDEAGGGTVRVRCG